VVYPNADEASAERVKDQRDRPTNEIHEDVIEPRGQGAYYRKPIGGANRQSPDQKSQDHRADQAVQRTTIDDFGLDYAGARAGVIYNALTIGTGKSHFVRDRLPASGALPLCMITWTESWLLSNLNHLLTNGAMA
jgi:hypothetical protein